MYLSLHYELGGICYLLVTQAVTDRYQKPGMLRAPVILSISSIPDKDCRCRVGMQIFNTSRHEGTASRISTALPYHT